MKKTTIYVVMAMLCLNFSAFAQPVRAKQLSPSKMQEGQKRFSHQPEEIKPLKVGDRLPETFWTSKHQVYRNGLLSQENLLTFKNHILIIDFWATWCTNCINRFPKVAMLSQKYQDIAKVLLVNTKGNKDKISQINTVYELLNADGKAFTLPTIVEDTLINQLLKPTFLPHYVWISREGKVVAITNSDFVDDAPIKAMHQQNQQLDSLRKKKREARP